MKGLCFFLILVSSTFGRTFFVSPTGSNANSGSAAQPWATPGYGSRQLAPGDTMVILGGRYVLSEFDADIITPPSGTASAWIVIRGEINNRPKLVGRDNLMTAVNLAGVSYVRIENLEITHDDQVTGEAAWFREGVQIVGAPCRHVVLQQLYIHHIDEFGMDIQDAEDLQILGCRIEYCGFGALGGPLGEAGGWRNVVIEGGSLSWSGHYYQGGDGSDRPYDRPDGFGIEPSQGPVLLKDLVVQHNYGDGLDSKAARTTISRCIVANNSCDGVKLWGPDSRIENTLIYGRGDGDPTPTPWAAIVIAPEEQANARFDIVHVTVDDALGENYLMYAQYDYPDVPVTINLINSIFCGRGPDCPIFINPAGSVTVRNCLFYFPNSERILVHGDQVYTAENIDKLGENILYGDPLFVRPAWGSDGDYHLQSASPAVNAGCVLGGELMTDLDENRRDDLPDIGVYEYGKPVGILNEQESFPARFQAAISPNPFRSATLFTCRLRSEGQLKAEVYDVLGRRRRILADEKATAGIHHMQWDGRDDEGLLLPCGIYFFRLTLGAETTVKKVLLVR
ncbi:MAG: T9SS type A sorting domain-containing protein [candidate division KSB1 bacterium]|nr:T9SS type A sorting domain-containing protein [candidate division KSB1 bacterium]